jgi:hypothetical protein
MGSRLLPPIAAMTRASQRMRDGIFIDNVADPTKPPGLQDDGDSW